MAEKETPDDDIIDVEAAPDVAEEDHLTFEQEENQEEHEEAGIAGKLLTAAGLLLAGGLLALWLGPKIAPSLPSGMAPVANWLAPGGADVEAEIAELRSAIESLPTPVTQADIDVSISEAVGNLSNEISSQIVDVANQVVVPDTSDIEARISALEIKLDGLRAELSSLVAQLSDISELGGEVSAETATQIATYAASLEGLKAEIETLAARNDELSRKLDGVSEAASKQVAEAETKVSEIEVNAELERNAAKLRASLNAVEVALEAGVSFDNAILDLQEAGVAGLSADLVDAADGVATMAQLRADFPDAAHAAIRATIMASAGDGILSTIGAFAKAQVAGRSLSPQEGLAPDAVLSRVEAELKRDNLAAAMAEIEVLPDAAISDAADDQMAIWIANATKRLNAVEAYEELVASLVTE